MITKTCYS